MESVKPRSVGHSNDMCLFFVAKDLLMLVFPVSTAKLFNLQELYTEYFSRQSGTQGITQ